MVSWQNIALLQAIEAYHTFAGGNAHLISYGSGLWDLGRWRIHFPSVMGADDDNFDDATLSEWMHNLSSVLAYIKVKDNTHFASRPTR